MHHRLRLAAAALLLCAAPAFADTLDWSTFLGSSGADQSRAVAHDADGNVIVVGDCMPGFPTTGGAFQTTHNGTYSDGFVTKIAADGTSILWSTYIGGELQDVPMSVAVDWRGYVYVAGYTSSRHILTTAGAFDTTFNTPQLYDAWVAKISPNGDSLKWCTYIGGTDDDLGQAVAVDSAQNVYVAGRTLSTNMPTTGGTLKPTHGGADGNDGFLFKIAPTGATLVYGTYIGSAVGSDIVTSLALAPGGVPVLAGYTNTNGFPVVNGFDMTWNGGSVGDPKDAFVMKLNQTASNYAWSSYYGGAGDDQILTIAIDAAGSVYIAGQTSSSTGFPTVGAYQATYGGANWDAFAAKIAPAGNALVYSTYIGSVGSDIADGCAVSSAGELALALTVSGAGTALPAPNGYDTSYNSNEDIWLGVLSASGSTVTAGSYFGGGSGALDRYPRIAIPQAGGKAAVVGVTNSSSFPAVNAIDGSHNGGFDGFALQYSTSAIASPPPPANNAITLSGTPELYATYTCIGVRQNFTGDENGDATGYLEYRVTGTSTWIRGVDMDRPTCLDGSIGVSCAEYGGGGTNIPPLRFAGSVFWLKPNTSYDVRVTLSDPDGGSGTASAVVTTRAEFVQPALGTTYYVNTATGDDTRNNATAQNPATPWKTITKAMTVAVAGNSIRVAAGVYYETLATNTGGSNASTMIQLIGDGGAILDGSDPAFLPGGAKANAWAPDPIGAGVYSVPFTGTTRIVCVDGNTRLYKAYTPATLVTSPWGMTTGFSYDGSKLYVKLADGSSPNAHTMNVARYGIGFDLEDSYWYVTGLHIRFFGTTLSSHDAGIDVHGNITGSVIKNNKIECVAGRSIFIEGGPSGPHDCLVESNLITDPSLSKFLWGAVKCNTSGSGDPDYCGSAHNDENTGITARGGRGNVIRYNEIRGLFDGMDTNGDKNRGSDAACDTDVYGNLVYDVGDDAIECDDGAEVNVRVFQNRFYMPFSGVSFGPALTGPIYFLYNVVTDYNHAHSTSEGNGMGVKLAISPPAAMWIVNNTFLTTGDANRRTPCIRANTPLANLRFYNNIAGSNLAEAIYAPNAGVYPGCRIDYNVYWDWKFFNGDQYGDLFWWESNSVKATMQAAGELSSGHAQFYPPAGSDYTAAIAKFAQRAGFEAHGKWGAPGVRKAGGTDGAYDLTSSSRCIDAGVVVPGITNGRYVGKGPDVGAFEWDPGIYTVKLPPGSEP